MNLDNVRKTITMRTVALLIVLFLSINITSAQGGKTVRGRAQPKEIMVNPRDSIDYPVRFCIILINGKMFSNQVNMNIDYGQKSRFFDNSTVADSQGRKMIFNSVADALSYMKSLGWDLTDTYVVTEDDDSDTYYVFEYKGDITKNYIPKTIADFKDK